MLRHDRFFIGSALSVATLVLLIPLTHAHDQTAPGPQPLDAETATAWVEARVQNQARWQDYACQMTSRLLVDGELELTMRHDVSFDGEGRFRLSLVAEDAAPKPGLLTGKRRREKREALEAWRARLLDLVLVYARVTPGQARDWLARATVAEEGDGDERRLRIRGEGYALSDDTMTVVRRPGEPLADALEVEAIVRERRVVMSLVNRRLGEEGPTVPHQAVVEVPSERLRLVLAFEGWRAK